MTTYSVHLWRLILYPPGELVFILFSYLKVFFILLFKKTISLISYIVVGNSEGNKVTETTLQEAEILWC
jgi:hypothetical protein